MKIELMLSPFDASVADMRRAAAQADDSGIGGLWTMDHVIGTVHSGRQSVLECLATLGAMAEATSHCRIGSLVLNAVSREPVVLAQALSTLQQVADGRLVVGLGAGGGGGDYGVELTTAGMTDHPAPIRRQRLAETTEILRRAWSSPSPGFEGSLARFGGGSGLLAPDPPPPVIFGGYGAKMASLAGELADGFNTVASHPDLHDLLSVARTARGERPFATSVFALNAPCWLDADSPERRRLQMADVDTLIIVTDGPHRAEVIADVARAAEASR